jgi:ferredoxin-type protein NapG
LSVDVPDDKVDRAHDRRSMFRLGLKKLMEPVANYIQERIEITLPVIREVIRPPGALPEKKFRDACYRCGNCVDVCPARAIRPLAGGDLDQTGTPHIDPDVAACVVCDELACMKACPSGALRVVEPHAIRMGRAEINDEVCVRSHGTECTLCLDKCPFGAQAIKLDSNGRVEVISSGCVGCGVCQFYCPTSPKAVVVYPM